MELQSRNPDWSYGLLAFVLWRTRCRQGEEERLEVVLVLVLVPELVLYNASASAGIRSSTRLSLPWGPGFWF